MVIETGISDKVFIIGMSLFFAILFGSLIGSTYLIKKEIVVGHLLFFSVALAIFITTGFFT